MTNLIPRPVHGVIDYVVSLSLIAAPWALGFADGGPATLIPVMFGITSLFYSLFTNYEVGVVKSIPFKVHLGLDLLSGVILAASPWMFGFANDVYLPHLIVGLMEVGVVLLSRTSTAHHGIRGVQA